MILIYQKYKNCLIIATNVNNVKKKMQKIAKMQCMSCVLVPPLQPKLSYFFLPLLTSLKDV